MSDISRIQSYLRSVAMTASSGERVPTVRQLMRDFSLTQPNVERALSALKDEGLIAAHVGRGTFFTGGTEPAAVTRRVTCEIARAV
ncbi:GntR family transcriptional regulator [Rhizobium sp. F40D2]|uniref:GntR family transcriptional regulator n=1 Tax=Rhizobium sp. F40D2 TaxID=3453141 RepID=UPI003F24E331